MSWMYTVLYLIAKKGMKVRAGFIHVPAHPSLAAIQSYPLVEMPSMSVELMTGGEKCHSDITEHRQGQPRTSVQLLTWRPFLSEAT